MGINEILPGTSQGLRRWTAAIQKQGGISLVEVLIALAIVATAVAMFLTSLSTGSRTVALIYERTTAENLARSQLEYTKSLDYTPAPSSYDTTPSLPSGFTLSARSLPLVGRDDNIQRIVVTVYRDGESVLSVEALKVNR
ncbi:MAG: type II secretion system protein [Chloroflexota bacterium]